MIHSDKPKEYTIGGFKGEQGTVIQIAGNKPEEIYQATKICSEFGYTKINLNCGCPSKRATDHFGVTLMKDPALTRALCDAMVEGVQGKDVELSVKCRTGVDNYDTYEHLSEFIGNISKSGIRNYIIHARKAILGFSTKKNHAIPKLNYEYVYKLVEQYPELSFSINGGICSSDEIKQHCSKGVC